MIRITTADLTSLCIEAFIASGLRTKDAKIATDHFLENEFSGKSSHGLVRIIEAIKTVQKHKITPQDIDLEYSSETVLRFDAQRQIGAIAVWQALQAGCKQAKKTAISFVGVRNYTASTGSLAYYLRRATDSDLIALMWCNSVALVSPPGAKKRMLGTNPFGIGIPSAGDTPIIADFATSAIAYGKLMVLKDQGKPAPEGVLIDTNGNSSTNPDDAFDGSILPLADYRGFSLGLMIELLAGPLIGAKSCKHDIYDNDGFAMILINPDLYGSDHFYEHISRYVSELQHTPMIDASSSLSLPGQRSKSILRKTHQNGYIDVPENTLNFLQTYVKEKTI